MWDNYSSYLHAYKTITTYDQYSSAETIQGRKLIKGGNYYLLGGFNRGNYSREETIQGRKLFAEIR